MPDVADIRSRLAAYLDAEVGDMRVLASGWETTVFEFVLKPGARTDKLPTRVPLVLRFYQGSEATAKAAREGLTMTRLCAAGYPVPRPYIRESSHAPLGAPFLIMQRASGGPLFTTKSFAHSFKTFSLGFAGFVRAQARMHRLAEHGFALDPLTPAHMIDGTPADAPLLDRLLAIIADRVEHGPLPELRDALEHLRGQAARFRDAPAALVHMDYHPQNVLVDGMRVTGVIDWVSADRGDRHLCAATTAVILATSAMEQPRWMDDNRAGNSLRALFTALYLPLYHALAPMQWARLRYCQGVAAMLRLSMFGMMCTRGPESVGFRPEAIANVIPAVVRILTAYTARKCGVPVTIPMPPPA